MWKKILNIFSFFKKPIPKTSINVQMIKGIAKYRTSPKFRKKIK